MKNKLKKTKGSVWSFVQLNDSVFPLIFHHLTVRLSVPKVFVQSKQQEWDTAYINLLHSITLIVPKATRRTWKEKPVGALHTTT